MDSFNTNARTHASNSEMSHQAGPAAAAQHDTSEEQPPHTNRNAHHLPSQPFASAGASTAAAPPAIVARERGQNAAVSFHKAPTGERSFGGGGGGGGTSSRLLRPRVGVQAPEDFAPNQAPGAAKESLTTADLLRSYASQNSSQMQFGEYQDRTTRHKHGPLRLNRLACVKYPLASGGIDESSYLSKCVPFIRYSSGAPAQQSGAAAAGGPQSSQQHEGHPPQSPSAMVVVAECDYYGQRGSTLEDQQRAEEADEVGPLGFARLPLKGGIRSLSFRNPYFFTALLMLVPLVFLLVVSAVLYQRSVIEPSQRVMADLSRIFDDVVMHLSSEQASASGMSIVTNIQQLFQGSNQKDFFSMWNEYLLVFSDRLWDTNERLYEANSLVSEKEDIMENVLGGLSPWAFVDLNYLSWTRLQSTTNTMNTDIMDFYDSLINQLILFNGALSLAGSVRVKSDTDELSSLFSIAMLSVAQVSKLFLQVKSDQAPGDVDEVALPFNEKETDFIIQSIATMHAMETILRFASDHRSAWQYLHEKTVGTGAVDSSVIPSLKFVNTKTALHSIGFAADTRENLLKMVELTYEGKPYTSFNATVSHTLRDDIWRLSGTTRLSLAEEAAVMQKIASSSDRARQVALIALMALCAAGLLYHLFRVLSYWQATAEHNALNHYARQLRGSLLRMHDAGLKMIRLELGDTSAEVKLSRRPRLRTITAEEREFYLGIGMLLQLEPYLPLPIRYPPRAVPPSAMVNKKLFLKPALLAKEVLVGIRLDFTATHIRATGKVEASSSSHRAKNRRASSHHQSQGFHLGHSTGSDPSPSASMKDNDNSSVSVGASSQTHLTAGHSLVSLDGPSGSTTVHMPNHNHFSDGLHGSLLKESSEASLQALGGVDAAHHAYKTEILRVVGALANARPHFHHGKKAAQTEEHKHTSGFRRNGGSFMQSNGDVATVWLNLCEEVEYANLLAFYVCTALLRYCAENEKPCPTLTVCCGNGIVGNVSSYSSGGSSSPPAVGGGGGNGANDNGSVRRKGERSGPSNRPRPRYEDLWPQSAFFANAEDDTNATVAVNVRALDSALESDGGAEATPGVLHKGGTAAGPVMGTVVAAGPEPGAPDRSSGSSEFAITQDNLLVVTTAGLSKRGRAAWLLKQLLGLSTSSGSASAADAISSNGATAAGHASSHGRQYQDRGSSGKLYKDGSGTISDVLLTTSTATNSDSSLEKVPLPAVLPPPFAPGKESACLTSVIVYGDVVKDLEMVHALSVIHHQPVMASEVAVEKMLQEREEFCARYDSSRSGHRRGQGKDSTTKAPPGVSEGPLVAFTGKDKRAVVNMDRFMAGLRAFVPAFIPVDLLERHREYVPVVGHRPFSSMKDSRKKKKNRGREADRKFGTSNRSPHNADGHSRRAQGQEPEMEHQLSEEDGNSAGGGHGDDAACMDLKDAFPVPKNENPGAFSQYRRQLVGRSPTHLPSYFHVRVPQQSVDREGRPLFNVVSDLQAVYTWATVELESQREDVHGVLSSWLRAFNLYTRLNYAVAVVEPNRVPLRGPSETEQMTGMVGDVKQAITDLRTDLVMHNEAAQLALLGEVSANRLMDLAGTVEDFVANGPLAGSTESRTKKANTQGDQAHFLRDMLLSPQAIDAVRLFVDASV